MRALSVSSTVQQSCISQPDCSLAAWFIRRPCGHIHLTVNEAMTTAPGAEIWVTAWFRLRALTQARPFGTLPAADLALYSPYVVGHQHDTVTA